MPIWPNMGTSWTLASKSDIKYFRQWKKFEKYLYFSNSIFTMMGAPEKKVILRFFSRHEVIYLWVKFQVSLTCPTGFLPTNTTFFTNIWREYFSPNILRVFDQPEVEFSKSGQNWANTRPLLLKTFESSNCVDRHIVHCRREMIYKPLYSAENTILINCVTRRSSKKSQFIIYLLTYLQYIIYL